MIQLPNLTYAVLILANLPHTLQNQNTWRMVNHFYNNFEKRNDNRYLSNSDISHEKRLCLNFPKSFDWVSSYKFHYSISPGDT